MSDLELKERDGIWYAYGSIGGKRIRRSLGTRDKKTASELLAHLQAKAWKRHTYGEEAVRLFEEAATSYMKQGGEARYLAPIIKYFKGRAIGTIKPAEIRNMALSIYPRHSAATRNRQAVIPARAVVNHAHDLGWCGPLKVKMFDVPKSNKHKPVDRVWLDAFLAQADKDGLPHLAACVLFMHQTAARVSEAINLLGEHVDLGERIAVLAKTKTEEWSVRHLTSELVARIVGLGLQEGERVFSYTERASVNRRMAKVCERAGITRRSTHSAGRHSFGTNAMSVEGADIKAAMDAGGWKSAKLFLETYVHSKDAGRALAEKFDRQSGKIGNILAQPEKRKGYRFGKKG
ncbi:tyrosine-type recombinase/integrase [Rhizobium sp. NZLR11]|uniref:tyrosine-type recombinase/integrase n=1 Tax=Rhizobium sp. NZLR11 TaxID=2731098 RepID=UPI001C82B364|nr:tyrosine-type recombinase/integrase [Rhizobium sp. NZLR11]MBX5206738.1 tyrosine-type recombinase/integrase [Rhizobium sp. NZLR11]